VVSALTIIITHLTSYQRIHKGHSNFPQPLNFLAFIRNKLLIRNQHSAISSEDEEEEEEEEEVR
jgi:hypothetical protein